MRCLFLLFVLFTANSCFGQLSSNAPISVAMYAKAALVGMQLSVKHAEAQGKVSLAIARCIYELSDDSFTPVFTRLLINNLTQEEIAVAEAFAGTTTGRKYAKLGLLQIYLVVGERSPEPLPSFTPNELASIEAFRATSAGNKLVDQKVLESPASRAVHGQQIQELLRGCRDLQPRS